MNRWTVLSAAMLILVFAAMGCSGGGSDPVAPTAGGDLTQQSESYGNTSNTVLWGVWDFHLDTVAGTLTSTPNRGAMWNANVVTFLNDDPTKMTFGMNDLDIQLDMVYVDIDVSLEHPFPAMPQFDGYDVRGIFMGDGSGTLAYNSDLDYPEPSDQFMLDDPVNGDGGGPDGYTRWYNTTEFPVEGVLGFTPGGYGTTNYISTATLCPYKYFTDDLDSHDDVWTHLNANAVDDGVFSSGEKNTRNYYLEFPLPTPGANFQYAVVASWHNATTHPANTIEAPAVSVTVTDSIWYVDPANWGGNLTMDVSIWSWVAQPAKIIIESTVLTTNLDIDTAFTFPTGNENYSTYHIDVAATAVTGTDGNEFWVICEYPPEDYTCPDTPAGGAPSDTLAAFFRYGLYVQPFPYNADPICDLQIVTTMPAEWFVEVPVEFDASASYDPDIGDVLTFEWDFDGDDIYDEDPDDDYTGTPENPTHVYLADYVGDVNLRVTDGVGGEAICTVQVDVTIKACGTLTCPSGAPTTMIGTPRLYYWPPQPVQDANTRVVVAYRGYAWCTVNVTGTAMYDIVYNSPSYYMYETAIASDDRIYYRDAGSSNRIYYCQYNPPFQNMRTTWGAALPSGYYTHKLSIDGDDNPIVLARGPSSSQPRVYHWNGTDWGSGINVPSDIMSQCGNNYSYIFDFDYDPSTGWYYFVERYNQHGVYAMDDSGTTQWSDTAIWSAVSGTAYQPGIFIDKADPECRMILMAGRNTSNQTTYWARYNPVGGEKATGTTYGGTYGSTFSTFYGRGCVQISGGTARYLASTYGGNVWSSTVVPSW